MTLGIPTLRPPSLKGTFGVGWEAAKNTFFDRAGVIARLDAAELRLLNWFGGYVMKVARRSLRRRKGPSNPGTPPSSHGQDLLKKGIVYGFDPGIGGRVKTVVVGPRVLNRPTGAPERNEFGGTDTVRGRTVVWPKRPFMRPALDKSWPKFAPKFKGQFGIAA